MNRRTGARHDAQTLALAAAMCLGFGLSLGMAQQSDPAAQRSPAAKAFLERVDHYMQVRNKAEQGVPPLDDTNNPQKISTREKALGEAIRQAREPAQQGELFGAAPSLFTTAVRQYWKQLSPAQRNGLMEELPSDALPKVNTVYPTTYPLVTFPPTLLAELPKLPDKLEYRLVGPHLILRDVQANLIVDVLPNAARTSSAGAKSK